MSRILDGLAARAVAIFLAGLIALQLAIALAAVWPERGPAAFRLPAPKSVAAMARVLELAPPALQPAILEALNNNGTVVKLAPDISDDNGRADSPDDAPALERFLRRRYEPELDGRSLRFEIETGGALLQSLTSRPIGAEGPIRLIVRLNNGQALSVERAPLLLRRLGNRFMAIAAAAAVVLLLILVFLMRQITRPVRRLAEGVRLLVADLRAPDLPMCGPRELQELAAACNEMKRQIRELLDDRTRILAAIAHDVRTYLTRLRLRTDFIDDFDQRKRAVSDLDEMGRLLEDTLTFAREARVTADGGAERVDVSAELAEFVSVRQEVGDPVRLESASDDLPYVRCSPLALRRILTNLTDNAIRYGDAAHLRVWREDGYVLIAVEDDGPGVPVEAAERLTAPFERLEPSRARETGGAGLGLAIVKALAESQGGALHLENRREGGLHARVTLRVAAGKTSGGVM